METIHDFNWKAYGTKDIYLDWQLTNDFDFDVILTWYYGNQIN